MEPNFPKALLRLARENRPDIGFQLKIALIVDRCIAGDWVSPLHEEYGEDVIHLIKSPLSPESASITPIFYVGTLDMITSSLDQDHFLRVAEHLFSSHRIHKAMDQGLSSKTPLPLFLKFTKRLIEVQLSVSYNVGALMEGQIWLVVGFLAKPMSVWNPRHGVSIAFINRILQEDEELHLPGYLLSEGILPANTYIGSARSRTLKPIEAENLKIYWKPETPAIWRPPPIHEATRYVWYGEAILLLWKKAKLEVARGKLAPDWDDSILFKTQVASGMMGYYKIVSDKGYHGIDWQSLLEYFHTLLLKTGCPPQVGGDHHVTAPEGNDEQPERNPRRRIIEMLPHVENLVNRGSVISAYKKDEMR